MNIITSNDLALAAEDGYCLFITRTPEGWAFYDLTVMQIGG